MGPSSDVSTGHIRRRLTARGHVQGVGFRPFVYRLAQRFGLAGHVLNTGDHVAIEIEGPRPAVEAFTEAVRTGPPPNAWLYTLEQSSVSPLRDAGFSILASEPATAPAVRIPPDQATCPECISELFDKANRRHGYGLINCTACGPRFTIVEALPYDRKRTTMRGFTLCLNCAAEYGDPADRRFHAEPVACPSCGPSVKFDHGERNATATEEEALACATALIAAGGVLAMKGIGGYHLVVDAANTKALATLRARKRRPSKPFALMASSLGMARKLAQLTAADEDLLQSAAAPIVLAARQPDAAVDPLVGPGCAELGLMLPYSPLHHLLLDAVQRPLVMTSANGCGEPIFYDDRSTRVGLRGIADGFLTHNRRIHRPAEDPVMRTIAGAPQVLRLGRGIAPAAISLSGAVVPEGPVILALGGNLKVAPVLLLGGDAICTPHIGDLENMAAEEALVRAVEDIQTLYGCRAEAIACDAHPDYATSILAKAFGLPVVPVQHHLAHSMSVVAEHGLAGPVAGVVWDGTGYGGDGTIWGGEFLNVAPGDWKRAARLRQFKLPGVDQAVREPRRALLGMLHAIGRLDLLPAGLFSRQEQAVLVSMLDSSLQAPVTSSAGRLFDGLAALLGVCAVNRHEGEAAMRLEALAQHTRAVNLASAYPFHLHRPGADRPMELDWEPLVTGAARDVANGIATAEIAARLHETLASMVAAGVATMPSVPVLLSGGCFQNRLLTERSIVHLSLAGRETFINRRVPPGDGGLALGQALWARKLLARG